MTAQAVIDRKRKLGKLFLDEGASLNWQDRDKVLQFLLTHHDAFVIHEGERGETDLIQMAIDTGEAYPK